MVTVQLPYFPRLWSMVETHPPAALDIEKTQGGGLYLFFKTAHSHLPQLCTSISAVSSSLEIVMNVSVSLDTNKAQETENKAQLEMRVTRTGIVLLENALPEVGELRLICFLSHRSPAWRRPLQPEDGTHAELHSDAASPSLSHSANCACKRGK